MTGAGGGGGLTGSSQLAARTARARAFSRARADPRNASLLWLFTSPTPEARHIREPRFPHDPVPLPWSLRRRGFSFQGGSESSRTRRVCFPNADWARFSRTWKKHL